MCLNNGGTQITRLEGGILLLLCVIFVLYNIIMAKRGEKPEDGDAIFHTWVWPGPYIFDKTDDSLKMDYTAPFTEEGKREIVDWINKQYETYKDIWSKKIL